MNETITIEDIINIWICMAKHIAELKNTDEKALEEIKTTYDKLLKIQIMKGHNV